jgi:hypothetical protein
LTVVTEVVDLEREDGRKSVVLGRENSGSL